MNCFHHEDRSAVGICKSCGKGLCRECATDLAEGLACHGHCESRVRLMNRILDNSARTVTAARLQTRMVDLVVLVVGIIFTFLGVWGLVRYEDALLVALFGLLGAVFVVFGLRGLSRKAQYPRIESPATTAEHSDVVVR